MQFDAKIGRMARRRNARKAVRQPNQAVLHAMRLHIAAHEDSDTAAPNARFEEIARNSVLANTVQACLQLVQSSSAAQREPAAKPFLRIIQCACSPVAQPSSINFCFEIEYPVGGLCRVDGRAERSLSNAQFSVRSRYRTR